MNIKRFISTGELYKPEELEDTDDLLVQAGRALDKSCTPDILGCVAFEGEDGKLYIINVDAVITEVDPEFIRDWCGIDPVTGEDFDV